MKLSAYWFFLFFFTGPNGTHFNFSNMNSSDLPNFDFEGSMTDNAIQLCYIGAGIAVLSFMQVSTHGFLCVSVDCFVSVFLIHMSGVCI